MKGRPLFLLLTQEVLADLLVAGGLDGLDDALESVFDRVERRGEAAFVADGRGEAASLEDLLEVMERLGGTVVKMIFPIELEGFKAREGLLKGYDVASLIQYPGK